MNLQRWEGLPKEDKKAKNETTLQATIAMLPDSQPETVTSRTTSDSPCLNKSSTSILVAASNKPAVEANKLLYNSLLPKEKETINAACSDILHTDQEEEEFEVSNEDSQLPATKSSISVVKKAMKQHRCY